MAGIGVAGFGIAARINIGDRYVQTAYVIKAKAPASRQTICACAAERCSSRRPAFGRQADYHHCRARPKTRSTPAHFKLSAMRTNLRNDWVQPVWSVDKPVRPARLQARPRLQTRLLYEIESAATDRLDCKRGIGMSGNDLGMKLLPSACPGIGSTSYVTIGSTCLDAQLDWSTGCSLPAIDSATVRIHMPRPQTPSVRPAELLLRRDLGSPVRASSSSQ